VGIFFTECETYLFMSNRSGLLFSLCAASAAFVAIAQQAPKQFTARELFYSAAVVSQPKAPRPQATNITPAPRTPPKQTATAPSTPPTPRPQTADPKPPRSTPPAPGKSDVILAADQRPSTAPAPASGPALGLKYTLLKKVDEKMVEVPTSTVFHAGDRIQLSVETNIPGYLYIISQGSSGTWKPMFPSPEVADGNNRVEGWRPYTMPPATRMVFDEQKGSEKIFIVFSREPEEDLEKMIYSLQGGKTQPASTPDAPPQPKQIMQYARLNIDDGTVGRLRNVYSRDLIIERVDQKTPGERKETAVYVVNPSGGASSRVVADLNLVHE
jgi:hypothetical protein